MATLGSNFQAVKGGTDAINHMPRVDGQVLFDIENICFYLDSMINGVLTRITFSKQPFIGTKEAWDELTDDQKMQYVGTHVIITNDYVQANYVFVPASASSPGTAGLVPAPAAGDQNKVIHGDGTWREAHDTTYTATTGTVGSASEGEDVALDEITSWNAGELPTLGTAIDADHITGWSAGTVPSFTYDDATEKVTCSVGTAPALTYEHNSVPNVTSIGSLPILTHESKTLPKIVLTPTNVVTAITEDT